MARRIGVQSGNRTRVAAERWGVEKTPVRWQMFLRTSFSLRIRTPASFFQTGGLVLTSQDGRMGSGLRFCDSQKLDH